MRQPTFVLSLIVLAGTLAPAQALVPSHAPSGSPALRIVARVNDVPITSDRLEAAVSTLIPVTSFHRNLSPEKLAEIRRKALDNVIDEELQYQEAVRLKLRVSDGDVERGLDRARAAYKTIRAFEEARKKAGVKLGDLRQSIRRALLVKKAYDQVVGAHCIVSRPEAAEFYRQNPERFVMPPQRHVFLITIGVDPAGSKQDWENGRLRAVAIAEQLKAGVSFEELARKHSTDPSRPKGGDLGLIHQGRLTEEFETAIKDLRPGEVTPVIQTIYGYHLLRVSEIRPSQPKTFDEVRARLVSDLTTTRCAEQSAAWIQRLRAAAAIEIFEEPGTADVRKAPINDPCDGR